MTLSIRRARADRPSPGVRGRPSRILLINPPSPERLGAPLLGLQYVAASLLARGCEVQVIDAAARNVDVDLAQIRQVADVFAPDMVGIGLFTRWVWHAYQLAAELEGQFDVLVAGGAHTTIRPDETLDHGFDIAVVGEAEETVRGLVDWLEGDAQLAQIPGIRFRDQHGMIAAGPAGQFVEDLDRLAPPLDAHDLFNAEWYGTGVETALPGGILTSRGCPARCTFCANYVTGRGFRYRSSDSVVDELNRYHEVSGLTFFPFWDDALTARRPRLLALCEALRDDVAFELGWSAITRATMVNGPVLEAMKAAGCSHVNFGVESGDDEILRAIKKGVRTDQVVRALELAKEVGLSTACNFMLGFPQETPRALENTLSFMQRIAPLVDTFSTLGVVVPFPGTPIYDDFHEQFGFTDWWLREDYSHYEPPPPVDDPAAFSRYYIDDRNLSLDFFDYSPAMRDLIQECLRFKGEHNLAHMGLLDPIHSPQPVPA